MKTQKQKIIYTKWNISSDLWMVASQSTTMLTFWTSLTRNKPKTNPKVPGTTDESTSILQNTITHIFKNDSFSLSDLS